MDDPHGGRKGPHRTSQLSRYNMNTMMGEPQGDRKGPHPAPLRPRPYNDNERGITRRRIIVRAGAEWGGVGTLAVALGNYLARIH